MDRITKALLDEFVVDNDLSDLSESTQFEHFTGYLVTAKHFTESFSTEDIHTGNGGDLGMDTMSIIANGVLISDPDEISELVGLNGYLDVTVVFSQAERSPGFSSSKIGQIEFGIQDFLSASPQLPRNPQMELKHKVFSEILRNSGRFRNGNPICYIYYCTTGRWNNDAHLSVRRDAAKEAIFSTGLFRKVDFECIGADGLQQLYRLSKNAVSATIEFANRIDLPRLPNVDQAYVGLLPAVEYWKLIDTDGSGINSTLFYDNIRHWQDWNLVNKEMKATLENENTQVYFPLLNNGVTVIAKKILQTGHILVIEDYQIVNGCQTSYVLHLSKRNVADSTLVPIRIIATGNDDVRNSIIKATNRQTQISEDQLLAITQFPKKLELFFSTFNGPKRLYYERRSRQYAAQDEVEKVRVVGMNTLVRAFAGMFREVPHRTTKNYRLLLSEVGEHIFNDSHRLEMYYVAAFAHYRLEYLFRRGTIDSKLKPARYHMLYLFRALSNAASLPQPNSREMERYCSVVMEDLWDDDRMTGIFLESARIIEEAAKGDFDRDNIRTEPFTERVKELARLRMA